VKQATEALVNEAQKVRSWSSYEHNESTVTVDERMVGGMAQVTRHVSSLTLVLTSVFGCAVLWATCPPPG